MEIKEVQKKKTVMIRTVTAVNCISKVMAEAYETLAGHMESNGISYAGPPYARYYNMDWKALDV